MLRHINDIKRQLSFNNPEEQKQSRADASSNQTPDLLPLETLVHQYKGDHASASIEKSFAEAQHALIEKISTNACWHAPYGINKHHQHPLLHDNTLRSEHFTLDAVHISQDGEMLEQVLKMLETWRDKGRDHFFDNRVLFIKQGRTYQFYMRSHTGAYQLFKFTADMYSKVVYQAAMTSMFQEAHHKPIQIFDTATQKQSRYHEIIFIAKKKAGYPSQWLAALRCITDTTNLLPHVNPMLFARAQKSNAALNASDKKTMEGGASNLSLRHDLLFHCLWLNLSNTYLIDKEAQEDLFNTFYIMLADIARMHNDFSPHDHPASPQEHLESLLAFTEHFPMPQNDVTTTSEEFAYRAAMTNHHASNGQQSPQADEHFKALRILNALQEEPHTLSNRNGSS